MTPPELLVQTQKAVGEKEMTEWHERLIKMREEERTLLSVNILLFHYTHIYICMYIFVYCYTIFQTTKDEEQQVEHLERRNAVLERDVARYRERETILRRVNILFSFHFMPFLVCITD